MPYLWLLVFFLIPFVIVIKISLSATAVAQPPYEPTFDLAAGLAGILDGIRQFALDNYQSPDRGRPLHPRLSVEPRDRRRSRRS